MNVTSRLANLLGALAVGLGDALEDAFNQEGFDLRSGAALVALLDFSSSGSVQRLSQVIGLTHSGTVRLVDRLSADRLVERYPGGDLRSLRVGLTAAGRRAALRLRTRRQKVTEPLLVGLTQEQRHQLASSCEVAITSLAVQRLAMRAAGETPAGGALCRLCDFAACGRAEGRCPAARTALAAPAHRYRRLAETQSTHA